MTELQIIKHNNQLVVDSRQVAEMVEKLHDQLMRSIRTYAEYLDSAKLQSRAFFIESTYTNSQNKQQPCYLITKKGCDMVANKMTGEKGVLFTANYIDKFYEMEKQLNKPMNQLEILVQSAQTLLEHDKQLKAIQTKINNTVSILSINVNEWRKDCADILKKTAYQLGGIECYRELQIEAYELLNKRYHVDLTDRLTRKKQRATLNGMAASHINKINKLDVIADDVKLIEYYISVCKDLAIKYELVSETA